jgi:hypothetical protein
MLKVDTYALATPEGRKPGTAGHRAALGYLRHRYAQIGLTTYGDMNDWQHTYPVRFRGKQANYYMHNLIGVIPGSDRSLAPVVIAAHYDSVIESYCADDNAAAVAVMLNVAQRIADAPLERDVIVAAFDGEEPPYFQGPAMGSTRFVEDVLDTCHVVIVMDLIGHPLDVAGVDPHLTVVTGVESHPNLIAAVSDHNLPLAVVNNNRVGDMSDHHAFRKAGFPFLFLSSGEWEDYHQTTDTPDLLDFTKMERVANTVESMARTADVLDLGSAVRHDVLALESASLALHLGGLMDVLADGQDTRTSTGVQKVVTGLRSGMAGWHQLSA